MSCTSYCLFHIFSYTLKSRKLKPFTFKHNRKADKMDFPRFIDFEKVILQTHILLVQRNTQNKREKAVPKTCDKYTSQLLKLPTKLSWIW